MDAAFRRKGERHTSDGCIIGSFRHDGHVVLTHQQQDSVDLAARSLEGFFTRVQAAGLSFTFSTPSLSNLLSKDTLA